MRASRYSFLATLSLLALPTLAQDSAPPFARPEVRGGTGHTPVEQVLLVTYDVPSARVRSLRATTPDQLALGVAPCYDNSLIEVPEDPQYVVANPGEELLAWGRKFCRGSNRLRSFTIAYRSEALDTSLGGPGAVFGLALHSGTTGFGTSGTEVFRRTFTGLPSYGAAASATVQYDHNGVPFLTGAAPLVFLTIDFGIDPLPLPDGQVGWSFLQLDGDSGPAMVQAPRAVLGTVDALDIYSPGPPAAATYVGTFNYGGCSAPPSQPPCANLFVQFSEIRNAEVARTLVLNGSGTNPTILEELLPARIGQVWAARVNVAAPCSGQPCTNPDFTVLFHSRAAQSPVTTRAGEILVDLNQLFLPPALAEGSYTFLLPADPALVGRRVFLQAAVLPPAATRITLTNALDVRIGY